MKHRKLQIAWSLVCGLAAVLLIALWVRSYWWTDTTSFSEVVSSYGNLHFYQRIVITFAPGDQPLRCYGYAYASDRVVITNIYGRSGPTIPFWVTVVPAIVIAFTPWIRYHFSLRTLFIATTLIAVVLSLIALTLRR